MPNDNKAVVLSGAQKRAQGSDPAIETIESVSKSEVNSGQPGAAILPARKKKRRRTKAIGIGTALRSEGLDEREVVQKLKGVFDKFANNGPEDLKFQTETFMACLRYLDDGPRAVAKKSGPLPARMIHDVPRPRRAKENEREKGK